MTGINFLSILGTNKAFRAPVYSSYGECIRGLLNQGFLGFYKGNMVGIGHACMTSYFKFHTFDMLDFEDYKFHHKVGILPKMIIGNKFYLLKPPVYPQS